ncbi:sigma-70 family RNA polymerase sigma factor [Streptomyces halobius]|uniref:Sigma-70 family RNA polymerase sigma factor n=1 Tax=Streptomyces halobius TaxID=2879846 RepID=A0ABY4M1E9_9ACTN|nr:sigma-70 family RNA polymerase sigma factor [Streptomyces halobius]UQA90689.1 sigma-70 family RNA polymerase sigma factor [Streptomyces halobius]
MSEEQERPDRTAPSPSVREPQRIPVAFWGFHDRFKRAYRQYAELHLGDERLAGRVVHTVFLNLLQGWARLMEEASPAASAWAHLKEAVDEVLIAQGRDSAMAETAVFHRVARAVLEDARDEFAAMESSIGLYPAIARLPGRQFDVMVLHYVLDCSTAKTASIMGITDATVRSHRLHARNRIACELGLQPDQD